jgi:hypothetical protein
MVAAQTAAQPQTSKNAQPIDCFPMIRALNKTELGNSTEAHIRREKLLAATARALAPAARERCLAKFLLAVSGDSSDLVNYDAVEGIEFLVKETRLSNSDAIDAMAECVRTGQISPLSNSSMCNRALHVLTRHQYGDGFFGGSGGGFARTSESRNALVDDWRALARQTARRYPIFDAYLAELCLGAVHALGAGLRDALTPFLPRWDSLPRYLEYRLENDVWLQNSGPEIFSWGIGSNLGGLPADWSERDALAGLRLLLLRPGLPNPSAVSMYGIGKAGEGFPVASSEYREGFAALDLEVRFQIVTSNDAVRRAAVDAVRSALAGLRQANAAFR